MALNFGGQENHALTAAVFDDPRVGDLFTEMLAFWVYVVARDGDTVTTMEASAPCTFPRDGKIVTGTLDEFRNRFAYGSIPGYWVRLHSRGNDVAGWLDDEWRTVAGTNTPEE